MCGIIDGTLTPIRTPSIDEHLFVGRHKKGHCLNIMAVVGPELQFLR